MKTINRQRVQEILDTIFELWEHKLWYGIDDQGRSNMIQEIMSAIYGMGDQEIQDKRPEGTSEEPTYFV